MFKFISCSEANNLDLKKAGEEGGKGQGKGGLDLKVGVGGQLKKT